MQFSCVAYQLCPARHQGGKEPISNNSIIMLKTFDDRGLTAIQHMKKSIATNHNSDHNKI